ncbi:hypothetical protein HED49_13160 [Ochrobactrum daejeonense]|nr:hypothetical protein [Brucella daejeonensis]
MCTENRKGRSLLYGRQQRLDKDWIGTVWMNPPYSNPEIQNFVAKAIGEVFSGRVTEAIILTNNSGDTGWHQDLQVACQAMCITRGRIRFESRTRNGNSPAMGQSFFISAPMANASRMHSLA